MIAIPLSGERPKSMMKFSCWYTEELDTYLEATRGTQSKADRAKGLMELGAVVEMAQRFGFYKLTPLRPFFTEKSCRTLALHVGHLSDPQSRFIESRGTCGRDY